MDINAGSSSVNLEPKSLDCDFDLADANLRGEERVSNLKPLSPDDDVAYIGTMPSENVRVEDENVGSAPVMSPRVCGVDLDDANIRGEERVSNLKPLSPDNDVVYVGSMPREKERVEDFDLDDANLRGEEKISSLNPLAPDDDDDVGTCSRENVRVEEIIETESDTDEVCGKILALCGVENASGDDALAESPMKSVVAKTIVKEEIIEMESDTVEVGGTMRALCGVENASGDDALAKSPMNSALAKTIVKKEIIEIESDTDEVCGEILALCGVENASLPDALAKSPMESVVAKTIVKKEIIEMESDTVGVGGTVRALCGVENASGDNALAKSPMESVVAKTTVKKEVIEMESDTVEVDGTMRALCGVENASGDDALAKSPMKSVVAKTIVKKEIIEIESDPDTDTDEVGGRMLPLCGAENASEDDTLAKDGKTNRNNMQIVSADDCDSGLVLDSEYKKYLARFNENGNLYFLGDNVRDRSPIRLMYNVDNEAFDRSQGRAGKTERSKAGRKATAPTGSSVSKRLKNENGRADHKSVSRTKETQQKKEDARRERKISVAKKNDKLKPTRDVKSQKNYRASKRLKTEVGRADHYSNSKTIPVANTRDTQRQKREDLRGRKIHVTKHNVKSKSSSHVKDNLFRSFKACKKENEKSLLSMDKSYAYFLAYLRNTIAICKSDRPVKPVKDAVSLSDPDIIAVSNHPFTDGVKSPFEATKDGKVIDLEDGIEPDVIFNSLFTKKLMKILRKPYDKEELLKLYNEASLKRPVTRTRQLRDGKEIEYIVDDQLAPSYLEKYTDFSNKYHRHGKDLPRALNLLRGFFFYLENIVLEGAFKPWLHEQRLTNVCFDASECQDIASNK